MPRIGDGGIDMWTFPVRFVVTFVRAAWDRFEFELVNIVNPRLRLRLSSRRRRQIAIRQLGNLQVMGAIPILRDILDEHPALPEACLSPSLRTIRIIHPIEID